MSREVEEVEEVEEVKVDEVEEVTAAAAAAAATAVAAAAEVAAAAATAAAMVVLVVAVERGLRLEPERETRHATRSQDTGGVCAGGGERARTSIQLRRRHFAPDPL